MLVLSRKAGEAILLDDGRIRIVIVDIGRETVRVGIDAPRSVAVLREEIVEAAAANRRALDAPAPEDLPTITPASQTPKKSP